MVLLFPCHKTGNKEFISCRPTRLSPYHLRQIALGSDWQLRIHSRLRLPFPPKSPSRWLTRALSILRGSVLRCEIQFPLPITETFINDHFGTFGFRPSLSSTGHGLTGDWWLRAISHRPAVDHVPTIRVHWGQIKWGIAGRPSDKSQPNQLSRFATASNHKKRTSWTQKKKHKMEKTETQLVGKSRK